MEESGILQLTSASADTEDASRLALACTWEGKSCKSQLHLYKGYFGEPLMTSDDNMLIDMEYRLKNFFLTS